jgi:hypothetical protein
MKYPSIRSPIGKFTRGIGESAEAVMAGTSCGADVRQDFHEPMVWSSRRGWAENLGYVGSDDRVSQNARALVSRCSSPARGLQFETGRADDRRTSMDVKGRRRRVGAANSSQIAR